MTWRHTVDQRERERKENEACFNSQSEVHDVRSAVLNGSPHVIPFISWTIQVLRPLCCSVLPLS